MLGLFGLGTELSADLAGNVSTAIRELWGVVYGQQPSNLELDLELCRQYFDPVARGHKLRERLAALGSVSAGFAETLAKLPDPVIVRAGSGLFLVGVEGRVLLDLLERNRDELRFRPSMGECLIANQVVLSTYRHWLRHRLDQVIALRDGRGDEVLQAKSVGLVLALLVNRSSVPERAIGRSTDEAVSKRIEMALHEAAGSFSYYVTGKLATQGDFRLKGGHSLTEASRRLAHRLVVTKAPRGNTTYVYVPEQHKNEVIEFLGRDLARRPGLDVHAVEKAFDELVATFRAAATHLAGQDMVFERPAETARIRQRLLLSFAASNAGNGA
jgi:hypothetical protein